jgi:predicted  nucleic acid-binding Zn-ribbon protein
MSEILSMGEKATKKENDLEPVLTKKLRAQETILEKQKEINELETRLNEKITIEKEIEETDEKLTKAEEVLVGLIKDLEI